MKDQHK